jgi:reactive intermediate/imine deaminase
MSVEHLNPQGLADPGTFTHVVKVGNTVYISGQVSRDAQGKVVGPGDIHAQCVQVFENLKIALQSVGADFSNVVKTNVYLTDARYRDALSQVRGQYLSAPLPASTLVVVTALASPDFLLEIEVVAVVE